MSVDGAAADSRQRRLRVELADAGLDALVVQSLIDVRYLSGFTGSSAMVIALSGGLAEEIGPSRFMTDFRYDAQSSQQVPDVYVRRIIPGELLDAVAGQLEGAGGRLGFDEDVITHAAHRKLGESLGDRWELVPTSGLVARLRAVKEAAEIDTMRTAAQIADRALSELVADGVVGRTEREVAIDLELRMRRLGASSASFPSIVAAGAHGALPHAEPTDRPIPPDVLITFDWGALYEGYCSDCTRTYATGEGISAEDREIYDVVLRAQLAGLEAVRAGRSGREIDAVSREVISAAGHGEHFGHGLGHGVGLEVHEAPRLSKAASEDPLLAGNVVTVEPGVYIPGSRGVRIEDLVAVGESSQEILTSLSKELTVIS